MVSKSSTSKERSCQGSMCTHLTFLAPPIILYIASEMANSLLGVGMPATVVRSRATLASTGFDNTLNIQAPPVLVVLQVFVYPLIG